MNLNSRQAAILVTLLNSDSPMSANDIGERIGLSARIIRNNVRGVNEWLYQFGAKIQSKPKNGLYLDCQPKERSEIKKVIANLKSTALYSQREREWNEAGRAFWLEVE